ncbi:hypothetical protein L9F63_021043, partial [Diploptera punctata]
ESVEPSDAISPFKFETFAIDKITLTADKNNQNKFINSDGRITCDCSGCQRLNTKDVPRAQLKENRIEESGPDFLNYKLGFSYFLTRNMNYINKGVVLN